MKLVNLRAETAQHETWKRAAANAGMTFSEWTRITLDAAATTRPTMRAPRKRREAVLALDSSSSGGKRSYAPDPKKR